MLISQQVITAAQKSQAKYSVPTSISIAQWALESSWGKRMSGKNNPFGIKAVKGQAGTSKMTWEIEHGVRVNKTQVFADYVDLDEAFDAHGHLLRFGSAYVLARSTKSSDDFARALQGHYATDTAYASKLISIMKTHNLYQYDVNLPQVKIVHSEEVVSTPPVIPETIAKTTKTEKAVVGGAAATVAVASTHFALWPWVIGMSSVFVVALIIYFLIFKHKGSS